MLRLIVGLLKPDSGTIEVFGNRLTRKKQELWEVRKKIGFLFQNPDNQLFAPTIQEDVGFGARNLGCSDIEVKKRVKWALNVVNLLEYASSSPFNLSWGQKKRAALAGLLVMKPKLLILDEPFANLDLNSVYNHLEMLERLRKEQNLTILFTTHYLFYVRNWADKMFVIHKGKKIFEGNPNIGLDQPKVKQIIGTLGKIRALLQKDK